MWKWTLFIQRSSDQNAEVEFLCVAVSSRWTRAHELLVQQKIRKDQLSLAVQESDAMLRYQDKYYCYYDSKIR